LAKKKVAKRRISKVVKGKVKAVNVKKVAKQIKKNNLVVQEQPRPKFNKDLARLGREAIQKYFEGSTVEVSERLKRKYADKAGIFVTLHHFNEQRGCIGFIEPMFPIWEGVINAALAAAFNDPRFMPLSAEELEECKIEVAVVEKPTPVKDIKEIEIGKHGLIVQKEHRTGLILPEVFCEYQVNAREALEMVCRNAGLHQDSWQEKDVTVLKFSTKKVKE